MARMCGDDCDEVCDFCFFYDFNGRADGCYVGLGACWHPEHPGPADPGEGCSDYHCRCRRPSGKTAAELDAES